MSRYRTNDLPARFILTQPTRLSEHLGNQEPGPTCVGWYLDFMGLVIHHNQSNLPNPKVVPFAARQKADSTPCVGQQSMRSRYTLASLLALLDVEVLLILGDSKGIDRLR